MVSSGRNPILTLLEISGSLDDEFIAKRVAERDDEELDL
jgi:hypothetical protein